MNCDLNIKHPHSTPRVLIIGTVPFKTDSPARALDSFFHFWPKDRLAQIFSDRTNPIKGHCSTLFQITDIDLIKRRFKRGDVGTIFSYDDLSYQESSSHSTKKENKFITFLFKVGKQRTSFTHLIRKLVWKRKYWLNQKLKSWVADFRPECIFLSISDDFFIQDIGLYFAELYRIPIICQIDDDYIFNRKFSINPFYHIYKRMYEKQIKRVMSKKTSAVYICDKIKKAYNTKYGISGETIYLSSGVDRRPFKPINCQKPSIVYFGSIRLDRFKSLIDIANALYQINDSFRIEVFSDEKDGKYINPLKKCKNIFFGGSIPYSDVVKKTSESDILLIVEGLSKFAIRSTRYSLSTKIADALTSGANLFAYGTNESGAIGYLKENDSAMVCTNREHLVEMLTKLIFNTAVQKKYYDMSLDASKNHMVVETCNAFMRLVSNLVGKE